MVEFTKYVIQIHFDRHFYVLGNILPCYTDECKRNRAYALGGVFAFILIFTFIYCLCDGCIGCPCKDNSTFVHSSSRQHEQEVYETERNVTQMQSLCNSNGFESGIWTSRYYQYGTWHGPQELFLSFDPQMTKITGSGWDDVGQFTVEGTFSEITRRIGLTKTYKAGTGNELQNLGHTVVIQLNENVHSHLFEGKWFVQTSKYHGEDKFNLKFERKEYEV